MSRRGRLVRAFGCGSVACALLAGACGGGGDGASSTSSGGTSGTSGTSGSSGTSGTSGTSGSSGSSGDGAVDAPIDSPDGAAPPCTRAAEAKTAPASLYDTFKADMVALTGDARIARVDAFLADIAAKGGTPLEDPKTGRVVFVVNGAPSGGAWTVVIGALSAWAPETTFTMTEVAGTTLYVLDTNAIPAAASRRYRLYPGATTDDPSGDGLARNITWDGVVRGAPTEFNFGRFDSIVHPAAIPATQGRLVWHGRVAGTMLGNSRNVYVYFPPKYDDGTCNPLPTILFNDGNEALTRGDYAGAADTLYAATPALSSVIVFAELASSDLQQRVDEYTFGTGTAKGVQYVDFLANDLWPAMKAKYRLCTKQEARGVAGASLGGLIASFGAFEKPNEWGWVGSQSGSYWWNGDALITRAQSTAKIPVRFYIDSTDNGPEDNYFAVVGFGNALQSKGYDFTRVQVAQPPSNPHDWAEFKTRAPQLLTHFRNGVAACN